MPNIIKQEFDQRKADIGFVNVQKANRIAVRNTLNTQAYLTRKNAINEVKSNFTLRNRFTISQIQVTPVKKDMRFAIRNMESRIGATEKADYLDRLERGGIRRPKSGNKLAIPQLGARGGSNRRLVRKQYYLKFIKNKVIRGKYQKAKTYRSKLVARAAVAYNQSKLIYYNKNIYKITSFDKTTRKFKMQLLYHVGKSSTRTPADPWLYPAGLKPARDGQNIYNSQLRKLLRKDLI